MANYYAGTSGLVLPVPNKGYYPIEFQDKSRLCYYASLFNSIEVNSSFYKIPQAKTIGKWAADVPADFRFTFKLWRGITHEKGLAYNPGNVHQFIQAISPIGEKKGCLLIQLPPSAKVSLLPRLVQLVNHIHDADPHKSWQIALEFRHVSWYNEAMQEFATNNGISIVIQDIPASATPIHFVDSSTIYLRFHGPGGSYRGSYSDDVLQEYSSYIVEWQEEGKTVYVYFNNTMGEAVRNLITFNEMNRV